MAAVPVTIVGSLTGENGRVEQVTIQGLAVITGLGVGGGPIIPPDKPPVSPGTPTHPIMLPGMPGWGDPHPAHPIVIPEPPVDPPIDVPPDVPPPTVGVKPPPPQGGWAYVSTWGWGYFPRGTSAGPKG